MNNESKKEVDHNRRGYDAWGKTYDTDPNSTVFADEAAFPAFWADVRSQKVLEIGCGTGRHTAKLAAQGNDVTALDLSAGMLEVARAKPALVAVRFIQGDVFAFEPEPGERFDAIVAALVLEHLRDLPEFFSRVARWLTPGGRAFFSEIHPSRMQAGSGARFKAQDGAEIRLASIAHREDDFHRAIAAAGLAAEAPQDVMATEDLLAANPGWEKYRDRPMLQVWTLFSQAKR